MMKPPLKLFIAITVAICLTLVVAKITALQAQVAESPQSPVPVVVNPAPKQYRVVDVTRVSTLNPRQALEQGLNEMGSQGWVLVTATDNYLIMMR